MKRALTLASAVFFWWPLVLVLILVFPYSGSVIWIAALIPTGAVSFVGSIFLLREVQSDADRRYLVLPFCLDTLAVLATGLFSFYLSRSFPIDTAGMFWAFAFLLLVPCSVAVFCSIPTSGRIRSVSMKVAAIISAFCVLTMCLLLYATYEPMLGLLSIYWLIGMPVIGVCYLLCANFF